MSIQASAQAIDFSHSIVNRLSFALLLLSFLVRLRTHTNCDTTRVKGLDSRILFSDPPAISEFNIINERRDKAG
ncbi:hypothetical protein PY650_05060 [Rhizobium calliandrae]|uniref:Secreted protein n=1 Tax=Rhizobium calliandrae TaxID=1312182 RepID=A0ABT7KA46_9HYPH|nr:hypothetical protein [Rhizobium calliandrae]MDL2405032.1 hypothetical protein [Rhizobium calliandrae]